MLCVALVFIKAKVKRQIKTFIVSFIVPPCLDEVQ
jgi:hypothetical protein